MQEYERYALSHALLAKLPVREVVTTSEPVKLKAEQAFKLESLGLLVPEGNLERPRCRLYAQYLADRLGV